MKSATYAMLVETPLYIGVSLQYHHNFFPRRHEYELELPFKTYYHDDVIKNHVFRVITHQS